MNERLHLKATLHGDGQLTCGPVPNLPGSPYVSPQERTEPDPSLAAQVRAFATAASSAVVDIVIERRRDSSTSPDQLAPQVAAGHHGTAECSAPADAARFDACPPRWYGHVNKSPDLHRCAAGMGPVRFRD
ncbi:MAG: hypothetical protein ACYCST_16005 [Acidimicrobiales bacterium]